MPPDDAPGGRTHATGMTTVSIAMCTYNGLRFLGKQLQSVLQQSRLPDQLVVCDDRSRDGTRELLQRFARTAPFPVELRFSERNRGVTENFAQAICACRGEIIALSDQDDVWHPEKLSRVVTMLDEHPQSGYVCSDAGLIDETGRALRGRLWQQWSVSPAALLEQDCDGTGRHLLKTNSITGATMAFRARLRPWLTPIPRSWLHDHWICTVCELLGEHGMATPELLLKYRLHPQQVCGVPKRGWWGRRKRRNVADRRADREANRQRILDLYRDLTERMIPLRPSLAVWLPVVQNAVEIAERQIQEHNQPWWRRAWIPLLTAVRELVAQRRSASGKAA